MYEHINGDSIVHSTLESGKDLIIKDQWKREYHFKIASFPVPTGLASEAIEVKEDNSPGYMFNILSNFDTDPEVADYCLGLRPSALKPFFGIQRKHPL